MTGTKSTCPDIDFAGCMETVARALLGEPNKSLSSRDELRYGTNGSLSINLKTGTWFDHETQEGGGVLDLIKREKGFERQEAIQYLQELGCIPKSIVSYDAAPPDIPYDKAADPFAGVKFKKTASRKQFHIVKTWKYVDETGEELFEVCRLENGEIGQDGKSPKTYKQRHKDAAGEYIYSVKGIRQVPYRLPELIEAIAQSKTIFVAEGRNAPMR
jgi:hypothetical protein